MNGCVKQVCVEGTTEGDQSFTEQFIVCRLDFHSTCTVTCEVQSIPVTAIVDSAARVTVMSDSLSPTIKGYAILHAAGRDMRINGHTMGPVCVQLGISAFEEDIYLAPIEDDMLLRLDITHKRKIYINTSESCHSNKG